MAIANIISISGGKDSTATLLLAQALEVDNMSAVFADTGHEHPATYDYVDYLSESTGIVIERVCADFSAQIAHKREYIKIHWAKDGVSQSHIDRALELLHPTGIPMLDLCLWKGRFPSTRRRFCSVELKRNPIYEQAILPLMDRYSMVLSWQGIRRDESKARQYLAETEDLGGGLYHYRPILKWPVSAVFEAHKYMGIKPNPLYKQGMGRVGCMPCIHSTKSEVLEITKRFPEELQRLSEWERLVSRVSKRGCSTFFDARVSNRHLGWPEITSDNVNLVTPDSHGVETYVSWAKTARGGRQFDLIKAIELHDVPACTSIYGLCE